tara:strand:+ start:158 stop:442 length:285 start_codon:yes stop_codon:yes gene_type:complete
MSQLFQQLHQQVVVEAAYVQLFVLLLLEGLEPQVDLEGVRVKLDVYHQQLVEQEIHLLLVHLKEILVDQELILLEEIILWVEQVVVELQLQEQE